jgi:S-(hydroxymethyl)mycothiol dehydrogenase
MAYEVKGVVARSKGAPVTVETIVVPDPGPGEAVIDVQACGVCATDLHYREGNINDEYPFLLGHEAAGVVAAVGAGGPSAGSAGPVSRASCSTASTPTTPRRR